MPILQDNQQPSSLLREGSTTIESIANKKYVSKEASRVEPKWVQSARVPVKDKTI